MLAGRKLLLADDSVTIQKVIELTFADEGVRVVTFSNGQDAIDHLEEIAPDIVLADVFMPSRNGYEVCEYVKQNEKLKHVPVMLLVGSFEPFDEAEARRVGADDILTKPFQSIRRLIDRVGSLVSSPPVVEKEMPTAELPKNGHSTPENIHLNTEQLEVVTADTKQLPQDLQETIEFPQPVMASEEFGDTIDMASADVKEQTAVDSSDVLLDLGEYEPGHAATADDFVLDLDVAPELEDTLGGAVSSPPLRAFVEPQVTETAQYAAATGFAYEPEVQAPVYSNVEEVAYESEEPVSVEPEAFPPVAQTGPLTPPPAVASAEPGSLSNQMIDAIARRVVEMMSEKVVREIAWEVVPDLAELLIKKQLEEKETN
ncbi:MAG TPA: response regulator [Pyrinomonadaceae bacterium]